MLHSVSHLESENNWAFYLELLSIIPYFQYIPISGSSVTREKKSVTDGRTSQKHLCLQPVGRRHNNPNPCADWAFWYKLPSDSNQPWNNFWYDHQALYWRNWPYSSGGTLKFAYMVTRLHMKGQHGGVDAFKRGKDISNLLIMPGEIIVKWRH